MIGISPRTPIKPRVRAAIDRTLRENLSRFGFVHAKIEPGEDHTGDPAIFVDAEYELSDEPVDSRVTLATLSMLRDKLIAWERSGFHIFGITLPTAKRCWGTLAAGLLGAARRLAGSSRGRPAQPYLKRAVSTAYYALFEAVARECADSLVGTGRARGTLAWAQVYRALEHGSARTACLQAKNLGLPVRVRAFADVFTALQEQRHQADYNPVARFSRAEVIDLINSAETAIRSLRSATRTERRDFAVLVLLRRR